MGGAGCGCAIVAAVLALIGTIPLLGWTNWIGAIPASLIAIGLSFAGLVNNPRNSLAVLGFIGGVLTLCWALFRLSLGGGII